MTSRVSYAVTIYCIDTATAEIVARKDKVFEAIEEAKRQLCPKHGDKVKVEISRQGDDIKIVVATPPETKDFVFDVVKMLMELVL